MCGDEMRRSWVVFLGFIVIVAAFTAVILTTTPPPRTVKPQVGIFFYVWYDPADEESWNKSKIVDHPVLGYYNSPDPEVIRQQLIWIEELGVDFVVLSWWGFYDDYGLFTDNAARQVFEIAEDINSTLKFAVMIEPFNKTGWYDYGEIYDHVFDTFVEPYSGLYYDYGGKPLICFFNDGGLTDDGVFPQDERSRFNIVTVGQQSYTDWMHVNLDMNDSSVQERRGQVSVTPRFDDSRFRNSSGPVDPDLSEGFYDEQWENALKLVREGKVSFVLISSWNEYVERTQIEPCYDGTADVPSDFLYNKTREYISQLGYEVNVQIHGEDYNAFTLGHLSDLGVIWVRMDYEFNITEEKMTALHNEGYKILATINSRTAPFTTLDDWNSTLLLIVSDAVSQFVDAWEVWNEPNAVDGTYVAPSDYREMLRCAWGILKKGTRGLIVSGGFAPADNFEDYLCEVFGGSDVNAYYDYFGLHLYGDLTENLDFIELAKNVTGRGVWVTELGRPSETDDYTEDGQASYLLNNFVGIYSEVEKVFVYELYDSEGLTSDKENFFGLLDKIYRKKSAYHALKELGWIPVE
jgi:hypothetical protein